MPQRMRRAVRPNDFIFVDLKPRVAHRMCDPGLFSLTLFGVVF
jgi:hypothetical protein